MASIRKTSVDFHYQLVIQRAYEEGEEQLKYDDDEEDDDDSKDEWIFLLDESLELRLLRKENNWVIAWLDLSGDPGDLFQFIINDPTNQTSIKIFMKEVNKCVYERKYQKSSSNASIKDLKEFEYFPDDVGDVSKFSDTKSLDIPKSTTNRIKLSLLKPRHDQIASSVESDYAFEDAQDTIEDPNVSKVHEDIVAKQKYSTPPQPIKGIEPNQQQIERLPEQPEENQKEQETLQPPSVEETPEGESIVKSKAELHLFDPTSGSFILQEPNSMVEVLDLGKWEYYLEVANSDEKLLGSLISQDMNPCFNFEHLSFIFNYFIEDKAFSWLLKFQDFDVLSEFQQGFMRALWEGLNQQKWLKVKDYERDYVLDAFNQLKLEEDNTGLEEIPEDDEDEFFTDDEPEKGTISTGLANKYESDSEEDSDEETRKYLTDGTKNSQLTVGYKNDRSYVVRGNKIGVFKHTDDDQLEFQTAIENIRGPKGNPFSPQKVMLHTGDSALVMQDQNNKNSLFKMDLEYGKVVEEWKVHDDIPVIEFGPSKKFSQMTNEQTFLGISSNGLFRVDPRLAGDKLVEGELKQYKSKNQFSALTTTENGFIAVASNKGDIRLYDRLGINAKTQLPALGEAIIGVDVSADGRWILATCKTYLLLIDALIKEGKNEGSLGFKKPFGKDTKPRPRRLQISPEHVAYMQQETKKPLDFTKAHFNTGVNAKEQTIVSSSGPYVITWSLKKILRDDREPYLIKSYDSDVMADDFKFGSDKNVIIALSDDVGMVNRKTFRKPTRESLVTPVRRVGALSRSSIVNSPY